MSETFRATRSAESSASARRMPTYSIRPSGRTFVSPGPDCDDDELRDALRRVRLLDWVERLPDGLDTHVGEGGHRLSAGERRRISVARALLADFPAIVFDEPTANLDQPTADALVRDILKATADRATVLITHRLSALELVDEIIVLNRGRRGGAGQARPVGPRRRPLRTGVEVRARPRRRTPIIDAVGGRARYMGALRKRERSRGFPPSTANLVSAR